MKNRLVSPASLLVISSIVVRVIVYFLLPVSDDLGRYGNTSALYISALTEHFGDYLSFTTNIPPATFIIDAFVFAVTGAKTAISIRAILILVSLLDVIAILLLFRTANRLGAGQRTSFFIMLLFSIALIPFELWRDGMHYDHLTFFFTSFFAWALVKLVKKPDTGNMLWLSFTGALLVSQSATNSAIVPVSVLLILFFLYLPKKQFGKLFFAIFISLLLPAVVLIIISRKNKAEGQEGLTSNKAGPAMMMVVQRAYKYDVVKVRQAAQDAGAPNWWLWTYDHATPPVDSVTGKQAEHWINLAQAFGICFFTPDGRSNNNPWQFNFNPLSQYLQQNGHTTLLTFVKADADDAVHKPYRFAGFSFELSPRWIGVYGDISKKIFFTTIKKNPLGMGKAFIEQQGIFSLYGPLFLYNTTQVKQSLLARSGLRTLHDPLPLQPLFVMTTLLYALLIFITYLLVLLNIPLTIWKLLKNARSGKKTGVINHFLLLSIPVLCIAGVYSCLVGGENDRYFIQGVPYLILLTTCLPAWFSGKLAKI
ncbi:MAG: hypothetical protein V4539_10935 [Bacteroidota bacterium]